jgi:F0F1-type ATP synthase assembly protein I
VKQPEEKDLGSASKGTRAANAATASSSAAEKEKEEAKKELDDAFSAAAEFLANAEVSACFFLVSF